MRMVSFKKKVWLVHKNKMSKEKQLRFLKRLTRLLQNGYPIIQALEVLKWDKDMTESTTIITYSLKSGKTIDRAFEEAHFHHFITSYLYFVRTNNDLVGSIEKCAYIFQQRIHNEKKFKQILRYPLILFVIFSLLLYFMKQFVLPSFANIIPNETDSTWTVIFSIKIIDFLGSLLLTTISLAILLSILWIWIKPKIPIQNRLQIYERIPIFRLYIKTQTSYFFATHFSSLLKTGMSFKEILKNMSEQQKLPIISYYTTILISELSNGVHLEHVLSKFQFLQKQLQSIFQKETDIEMLEKDLSIYSEMLLEEIENKTVKIITLLQPVFFIILGAFIIFIYVTLMWPMFQIIKTI
ncbi:competence type IV pilus assembly protein ComGB [Oceanobacillus senegalensis]|uniref:competence type IV pilus assembly protein ComGB n=1 Tax=Oceanobacillus senegalensis TaxID=1936063 RepID=UPI000A3081A3|nr:competence type IV pilus assembly protein ComGB [Oceanobacillus senegalensis]